MSTLSLNDELYQRASEVAAAQGKSTDEFVQQILTDALSQCSPQRKFRNELPTLVVCDSTPKIDLQKVRNLLEEEGF